LRDKIRLIPLVGLLLSVLALMAIVLLPTAPSRLAVTMLLVCFLPGWALVEGLFATCPFGTLGPLGTLAGERPGLIKRLLLGLGTSYVITIVGGLWLHYALGRLTLFSMLTLYTVVGLVGFGLALARQPHAQTTDHRPQAAETDWRGRIFRRYPEGISSVVRGLWSEAGGLRRNRWLLGLLIFAAYFRFYFLAYSDFRGDEAEVVLRATAAIRGIGEPLLSHTKGPAETLLAAAFGLLYGAFGELTARLPFALGNWLAVIGTYLLGHRLFGRRVALIGGALVAINGWFITYGRTAQYQNLVLPLSILGIWCYTRFYQGRAHAYHLLGTLLLATATFGHYEGASAAPAALYLLVLGLRRRGEWNLRRMWPVGLSLLVGAVVVLSFYAPFILNPTVAGAQSHVAKRFGGSPPYNSWDAFYVNGLFYNSMYYVLGVGGVLLLGALRGVRQAIGDGQRGTLAAVGALPLLLLCWTGLLTPWYVLLVYLGLMGLFLLSPRVSVPVKTNLLWVLLPFGLYLFAVERPGNHYYVFMPPLMLLAALTLDRGLRWLADRSPLGNQLRRSLGWALPVGVGVLLAWYGLSAWYQHLVFLRTDLEYLLTYPKHRNSIFWSDPRYPFDIRIGWGFPYRLGWQTVSELYRGGQLAGDWYSTDENNSIYWYTLGWMRNPCYPRYFMLTEIGYHEPPLEMPLETIERHYALRATVQVNGRPRLRLYEFAPLGSEGQPVVYDEPARYPTPYRQEMLKGDPLTGPVPQPSISLNPSRRFKPHPDMLAHLVEAYDDPRILQVRDEVSLLGYDVDDTWAAPGGVLLLTLYWETDSGLVFPYKVFTHVGDTQLWAQADDEPGCGQFPTYQWRAGDRVIDRHAIFLPTDMPPGDYPLQVGLYETRTGLRLDVLDELGGPAGNFLSLPPVTVRSAD
jgi:4-amino-4-deoxy-L-arabinose transferase-like glycosyltransferase